MLRLFFYLVLYQLVSVFGWDAGSVFEHKKVICAQISVCTGVVQL
jgi:hypothetical protein